MTKRHEKFHRAKSRNGMVLVQSFSTRRFFIKAKVEKLSITLLTMSNFELWIVIKKGFLKRREL